MTIQSPSLGACPIPISSNVLGPFPGPGEAVEAGLLGGVGVAGLLPGVDGLLPGVDGLLAGPGPGL